MSVPTIIPPGGGIGGRHMASVEGGNEAVGGGRGAEEAEEGKWGRE